MLRAAIRFCPALAALCALVLGVSAHSSQPRTSTVELQVARGAPLLGGTKAQVAVRSAVDEPDRFVAIVAADIDADGDLDVVASDSSLQLHVWVNDGSGHFTTRQPEKGRAWRADPSPSFDTGSDRTESSTQTDPPVLRLNARTSAAAPTASARTAGHTGVRPRTADRSTSAPRAPPIASL